MNALYPAAIALLPALLGPLPDPSGSMTFKLCGSDRVVTIEFDRDPPVPPQNSPPCHAKACHRKQFDPAQ